MIVPMKKVAVIVQSKDAKSEMKALRLTGVLHVEHQDLPIGDDITSLKDDITHVNSAISILSGPEFASKNNLREGKRVKDWKTAARHVMDLWKRLDHLQEFSRSIKNKIEEWRIWGDFDLDAVQKLAEKNIYVRLYKITPSDFKNIPQSPDIAVKKLFSQGGVFGCAVVSKGKIEIPFKELEIPKLSLARMRARLAEDAQTIRAIKDNLARHLCYSETFERIKKALEKELEFHEALRGMGKAGAISYIKGYVPKDSVNKLLRKAKEARWGVLVTDPSDDDAVPTLIRNPKWISVIEPVFKILEIVPGYKELDISLWFLLFFSVFFGMLIGDAGYGVIFLILTLFARRKWGNVIKDKAVFFLLYILSGSAIIWGILTGTFFGQEWLGQSVKPLMPALRNDRNVQTFCFFLGALHLSVAHLWQTLKKLPSIQAFSDIGWISIIWGGFFLAKVLILGEDFPGFGKWLFIVGPLLVVFFTNPKKSIFKTVGTGLGTLLLNFVNSFTDVVSYIRLFAVGLAGLAIADGFNQMAMSVGFNSVLNSVLTALILFLGHALNVMLGPLAVLVHGVRLNVLEFCTHLDIKWSGFSYRPLIEETSPEREGHEF